jgi:hypothetical protein
MALTIAHRRTLNREQEQWVQLHSDKPWLIFQPVPGWLTLAARWLECSQAALQRLQFGLAGLQVGDSAAVSASLWASARPIQARG